MLLVCKGEEWEGGGGEVEVVRGGGLGREGGE